MPFAELIQAAEDQALQAFRQLDLVEGIGIVGVDVVVTDEIDQFFQVEGIAFGLLHNPLQQRARQRRLWPCAGDLGKANARQLFEFVSAQLLELDFAVVGQRADALHL